MPRRARCIPPNVAHHITQRGVDGCAIFRDDGDRLRSLGLLRDNLPSARVRLLGCTDAGRPLGDEPFMAGLEQRYGRQWAARTREPPTAHGVPDESQMKLF